MPEVSAAAPTTVNSTGGASGTDIAPRRAIRVRVSGRNLFVDVLRMDVATRKRVATIPAGYVCSTGAKMFPATLVVGRRLRKIFGADGIEFVGEGSERLVNWLDQFETAHRLRDAEDAQLPPVPGERMASWLHQRRGFWFGYHLPSVLLSEKVGAGKTKQIIDICNVRNRKRILVATTASAVDDWQTHIDKHATRPYAVLTIGGEWRGKNSTRKAEAIKAHVAANEYSVTVLSHDSIWRPPLGAIIGNVAGGKHAIGILAELDFDIFVIDELHALSDPAGRRSLFIWRLSERIPERIGATGTVVRHRPENVFAMYRALDAGIFGVRKDDFLERYCVFNRPSDDEIKRERAKKAAGQPTLPGFQNIDSGTDVAPRYVVGYQRTDELAKLMSAITYDPGELDLHLPIPIHTTRRAFLSIAAQRVYDELENDFVTTLEDSTEIVAQNVLTQMLRLHQCAGGFVGKPVIDPATGEIDFVEVHEVDDAKEKLLEETLSAIDASDPVIIVGRFKHDLEIFRRVCRRTGRKMLEQSGRRKERIAWQTASGGEVLGAQIQSACEAIDLTRARYTIFYSIGFSRYQLAQMYGRTDRPGQLRQPNYIHLVSAGTIDEKIYKSIKAHDDMARIIMQQLKAARYVR